MGSGRFWSSCLAISNSSVDLEGGKVVATQADEGDHRKIATIPQNLTGLPLAVSYKEVHFLGEFNSKVEETAEH